MFWLSLLTAVLALALVDVAAQTSATVGDRSPLRIMAVDVQPPYAAPDTLCRLRVRIRNTGTEAASDLTFEVTVGGQRLAPYLNHTFRTDLQPGKETDVPLYNFWSSEAGRPFPKDGRLVVEVRLTGARWVRQGTGTTAAREVQPLPAAMSVTLTARKSP